MLLSIKEMELRKLKFAETYQPGEIDFAGENVSQSGPLTAQGQAEILAHTGEEVRVQGKVQADLEAECDRCLGTAVFHIDTPFDLFYKPAGGAAAKEQEAAIDEGEAEIGFYEMPGLVLEDILREQLLLQLPMQRVCSEACKGICPACGGNRNEIDCDCQRHSNDRWKALNDLHI